MSDNQTTPPVVVNPEEQFEEQTMQKQTSTIMYAVYAVLIILGVGTGYLLSTKMGSGTTASKVINSDKVAGIADEKTFKDSAEGTLEEGGTDGEGTHRLIREGGPSQTVTLISSAVDLDSYIDKKVRVWGETNNAKKAAWLMDVGKIELLE